MTPTFTLTENELKAALVLVKSCLDGMGGTRPADLAKDEYTWVSANDLVEAGWSRHEAAGTFGALMEKGMISPYDKDASTLTTPAWRWLDTVWDENLPQPEPQADLDDTRAMMVKPTTGTSNAPSLLTALTAADNWLSEMEQSVVSGRAQGRDIQTFRFGGITLAELNTLVSDALQAEAIRAHRRGI